jgi:hypothetical protein
MTKENRLWVTRLKCAMPNSQKALKRGSAKAQTLWCIAEALQKHSGAVIFMGRIVHFSFFLTIYPFSVPLYFFSARDQTYLALRTNEQACCVSYDACLHRFAFSKVLKCSTPQERSWNTATCEKRQKEKCSRVLPETLPA